VTIESLLERIAVALEAPKEDMPAPVVAPKAAAKKKRTSKKKAPVVEEPEEEPEDDWDVEEEEVEEVTLEQVKAALVAYQKASGSPELARKLLAKAGGAATLKALDPAKYQAVYDAAVKAAE